MGSETLKPEKAVGLGVSGFSWFSIWVVVKIKVPFWVP